MVFGNIFGSAGTGAGLFSVNTGGTKPQPGADIDFEDADDDTYDDTTTSLFTSGIHGANNRAKIVQEQSPEARAVLGFLGSFIQATQESAGAQATYASDPGSVSTAAAGGMKSSSPTVTDRIQKDEDLESRPSRSDFGTQPTAPKPSADEPKAAKPSAEKPTADKASADKPSSPK
ncbi:hypothetical protein [Kitasatospora griseola]|uniref:hypothetical protein n=1 Tax=Kitasatospora griseola TaxID=2064 RepID=UPI003827BAA4